MTISLDDLRQFTGTTEWFRHALVRDITYTEGAQYLAEKASAYWLLDEIAIANKYEPKVKQQEFQVWRLRRDVDEIDGKKEIRGTGADLMVEDGNYNEVWRKRIEYTDFPLPEIDLWFTDNVIMLPSEY